MADIKRLHKIIHDMGSDPEVSMHDLVREVLKLTPTQPTAMIGAK